MSSIFAFLLLFSLGSCVHPRVKPDLTEITPPLSALDPKKPAGCLGLMNGYCDSLYAPGAEGNIIINKRKGTPIYILQGKTANGLNQVFYELAKSKIRNKLNFPPDFYSILKAHRYFEKLEDLLDRKPFSTMSVIDRIDSNELESDVDYLWSLAIRDTLMMRISTRFPEFPKISDDLLSPEMTHFERLEKKILLSEIAKATWHNHPNWKKVTVSFEALRKNFLKVIEQLPIGPSLKADWHDRISSVELVLPGSLPEITDQDCTSTTINAYYYSNLNVITVCAGDFNSEDILLTLSHEMSHALDIDRSLTLFFKNSDVSKGLKKINEELCHSPKKAFSCADWDEFKNHLDDQLVPLAHFQASVIKTQKCLKREESTRPLDSSAIERFAKLAVKDRIRNLADEEAFLRITQTKLPLRNGKKAHNPSYLDPCHYLQTNWDHEALDGELAFLTAFTAEYNCSSKQELPERLKHSIILAQDIFTDILESMIQSEGEFSSRRALVEENFASSPSERFADLLGSYVMAESMKEHQSLWDKRMTFLASNSWQCSGPSLSTVFPKETLIMRQYLQDSHTDGDERKKELLSSPIREALSCDKDFVWNECRFNE